MSNTVRDALAEAAQSLEAIATQAGRYDVMEGIPDIRAYARNRALVARAALAQSEAQPALCPCKDRLASECPGEWEPGCDLGANEKHVGVVPVEPATLSDEDIEEATHESGLDWHRGWPIGDEPNRYAVLCRAIESLVVARMRGEGK